MTKGRETGGDWPSGQYNVSVCLKRRAMCCRLGLEMTLLIQLLMDQYERRGHKRSHTGSGVAMVPLREVNAYTWDSDRCVAITPFCCFRPSLYMFLEKFKLTLRIYLI